MMIDYQEIFHTGIRVPDLEAAMAELAAPLSVTWAEVREVAAQALWTPADGQREVPLKFVYSCEGPQHLELLEGPPGTVWDGRESPGVHHVGVWVDDVAAETRECVDSGWTVVAAQASPDDGYGMFSYVAPPSGTIVELVSEAIRPFFREWWDQGLQ